MDIYLYNSLTKTKELFVPMNPPNVSLYTCGPTVYDYPHIGHGRKFLMDDILRRVLMYNDFNVKHVQNITDVGHLVSDADEGEDKLEKGAKKQGKTVWEVADYFTNIFFESMDKLNILRPVISCKATDHIKEQIVLIGKLFENNLAYDTYEAVYFDVSKFPDYGKLFGQKLEDKKIAAREEVKIDENKRNSADFALWFKRVGNYKDHTMHWESPWGDGFPGWHIECSAMSMKYLGEQIDIHTGGEDHLSIHHPNEIAQSEGATGKKPFSRFWLHSAFLTVDGTKMSKSLGNVYSIEDLINKGYDPISLRYLFLTAGYHDPMNFTFESLTAAQVGLKRLQSTVYGLQNSDRTKLSNEKLESVDEYRNKFMEAVNDDLNIAKALAVVWEVLKSNIPSVDKYDLIISFDEVLGLNLKSQTSNTKQIPENIQTLISKREDLRKEKKFDEADKIRKEIENLGYEVKDKYV